jgi:hypothetical protein
MDSRLVKIQNLLTKIGYSLYRAEGREGDLYWRVEPNLAKFRVAIPARECEDTTTTEGCDDGQREDSK